MFIYLNFETFERIINFYRSEIYLKNAYDVSCKNEFDWDTIGLEFKEQCWSNKAEDYFKFLVKDKNKFSWMVVKHGIDSISIDY